MNTGAHLIINWALLSNTRWQTLTAAILIGALLPDAAMFVFYIYQKFILQTPEMQIWQVAYFQAHWQAIFDIFNSVPLILVLLVVGLYTKKIFIQALAISMLMHCALDLPLHNDDAHRHFYPFSNWKFISPFSYWDPKHYGQLFTIVEIVLVCISFAVIFKKINDLKKRLFACLIASINVVYFLMGWFFWSQV